MRLDSSMAYLRRAFPTLDLCERPSDSPLRLEADHLEEVNGRASPFVFVSFSHQSGRE